MTQDDGACVAAAGPRQWPCGLLGADERVLAPSNEFIPVSHPTGAVQHKVVDFLPVPPFKSMLSLLSPTCQERVYSCTLGLCRGPRHCTGASLSGDFTSGKSGAILG